MAFTARHLLPAYLASPPPGGDGGEPAACKGTAAVSAAAPGYEVAAKCAALKALAKALTPESEHDDVSRGWPVGVARARKHRPGASAPAASRHRSSEQRPGRSAWAADRQQGRGSPVLIRKWALAARRPPPLLGAGARRDHPRGGRLHGRARPVRGVLPGRPMLKGSPGSPPCCRGSRGIPRGLWWRDASEDLCGGLGLDPSPLEPATANGRSC